MKTSDNQPIYLPLSDFKIVNLGWDVNENDFAVTVMAPFTHTQEAIVFRWHNQLEINLCYKTDYGGMPLIAQAELLRHDGWLLVTIDCKGLPEGVVKLRCQEVQIGETIYQI